MLKMSKNPRNITIFEGPDGSGKTTIAKEYAKRTGALYVHFEAYYGVKDIHKFFIEAMQPALLGYQDVVLDRCWHSGPIYDMFFRNLEIDEQRQTPEICLLLDRAAQHCNAVLVNCRPEEETCISNWRSRLGSELVKSEFKMRGIYKAYADLGETTVLPTITWDYTQTGCVIENLLNAVKNERNLYNNGYHVHFVVSSGAKTNADVMIDIPGVRFDKRSNEYKLAEMFGFMADVDVGNVVTEELVKFLPVDTNFTEYFYRGNHKSDNQILVAIGDDAIAAVNAFQNAVESVDKHNLVRGLSIVYGYDILADSHVREIRGIDSLDEWVRDAYNNVSTGNVIGDKEDSPSTDKTPGSQASESVGGPTHQSSTYSASSCDESQKLVVIELTMIGEQLGALMDKLFGGIKNDSK